MKYVSVSEATKKWGISEGRVQKLCEENRIQGVARFSYMWMIPQKAEKPEKPVDGRKKLTTEDSLIGTLNKKGVV